MIITPKQQVKFNANQFVQDLLDEGARTPCDETSESFKRGQELPPFYNDAMFKRGQQFYQRNIFALFFSKLLGLLTVLAIPSILCILQHTKMSSTAKTAYRRYLATLFHMNVWYDDEFYPGSKLWQSICDVKNKHNSASKKACAAGLNRINQKDMALTQFGFMGYALSSSELVGIHNVTEEEWRDFIHVWRVVGYIMGLEDRFNLCRETVQETRDICNILIDKVFRNSVQQQKKDFMKMGQALVEGMWSMNPTLKFEVFFAYLIRVLQSPLNKNNNNKIINENYERLSFFGKFHYFVVVSVMYTLQFTVFRLYHNYVQFMALWLMHHCPFLGYYRWGIEYSHVEIFPDSHKVKQ